MEEIDQIHVFSFLVMVSAARPFGFLAGFTIVNMTIKRGTLLRIAISIALGLPIAFAYLPILNEVFVQNSMVDRTFLPVKEAMIGFIFGFVASLPFYAFKYAGNMCDEYRGEGSNALPFEGSETVTTASLLFYIVLVSIFLGNDGLWRLFALFYGSYSVWPIDTFLPALKSGAPLVLIDQLVATFLLTVKVGAPLLFVLVLSDVFLMVASRIGQRYGLNELNFLSKNLVFLTLLPIYTIYISRVALDTQADIMNGTLLLEMIFE